MTTQKKEISFGLITLTDFESFKSELNIFLNTDYKNDNNNFIFNNDICICKITKETFPNWINDFYIDYKIKNQEKILNKTNHIIIIYKYSDFEYLIEKHGNINLSNFLDNYDYFKFEDLKEWKKIYNKLKNNNKTEPIKEAITQFLLHNNNIEIETIKKNEMYKNISNNISLDECNLTNLLKIFDTIPMVENNKKLMPYNYTECLTKKEKKERSSETIYNKKVCENTDRFINLDTICNLTKGCEIADIYDKKNKLLFHNKKNKDLRVLSQQVINSALILKDEESSRNFVDKYGINISGSKYVFGIINQKQLKNKSGKEQLTLKDKLALGTACYILNKLNIEYYIDFIDYIK